MTGRDPCIQEEGGKALSHLLPAAPLSGCTQAVHWCMNTLKTSSVFIYIFLYLQCGNNEREAHIVTYNNTVVV